MGPSFETGTVARSGNVRIAGVFAQPKLHGLPGFLRDARYRPPFTAGFAICRSEDLAAFRPGASAHDHGAVAARRGRHRWKGGAHGSWTAPSGGSMRMQPDRRAGLSSGTAPCRRARRTVSTWQDRTCRKRCWRLSSSASTCHRQPVPDEVKAVQPAPRAEEISTIHRRRCPSHSWSFRRQIPEGTHTIGPRRVSGITHRHMQSCALPSDCSHAQQSARLGLSASLPMIRPR
jgi:hypothetical protein